MGNIDRRQAAAVATGWKQSRALEQAKMAGSPQGIRIGLSRRTFLRAFAGGAAWASFGPYARAEDHPSDGKRSILIAGFTKPLQHLPFSESAAVCRRIGWDGVECPVRPGGQVEPEQAADDLPRLSEALTAEGLHVLVLATAILSPDSPHAETVLRAAASLGIRDFRMGWYRYDPSRALHDQLSDFASQLRDLAAMCQDLGVRALYHNHSGATFVGAPVWDAAELVRGADPEGAALMFDVGHATVEGGLAWPLHLRQARKRIGALCVKDFVWERADSGQWLPKWQPLGHGMVGRDIVRAAADSSFRGTIVQHHEYPEVEGGAARDLEGAVRWMRCDLEVLRRWLALKTE